MSYIDAGYIAALSVLFVYGAWLVHRRRRLERPTGVSSFGAELERRAAEQ